MASVSATVTITMVGDLPSVAFAKKEKEALEEAIKDSVVDMLGEYEIWGERFGNDENVYALFLRDVKLSRTESTANKKKKRSAVRKQASSKKTEQDASRQSKLKKLRNLRPGDKFAYKNVGFGCTSYEKGDNVIEVRRGKLFTETFDGMGMEWDGETWKFDGGVGLVTYIVLMEDVPKGTKFGE